MKDLKIFNKKNLFSKMLLIYSAITVIAIYLLATIFLKYYVDNEIQNQLNIHSELIFNVEKRFEEQNIVSNSVINGINTQKHITDEISTLISSTYEEYISYKLDKFMISNTKQPDLDYVLSTILSGREDALAVVINDKNKEYVSEIVLKYDRWYELKNKMNHRYIRKISKPIRNVDSEYILGYIDIYFDLSSINNLIEGSNLKGRLLISDDTNNIMFDSTKNVSPWDNIKLDDKYNYVYNLENKNAHIDKEIININQDAQTKYKYISIINEDEIGIANIKFKIFFISILCTVIIIMITSLTINTYAIKLKYMINIIGEIKKGNLDVRFNIKDEEDELDVIAKEIDRMCENLKYHIDKTYKSEVRQKDAELNALQAQIKPHFLYNTLEVIRMCALTSKNREVAQMIYNLASMFRYQTYNNASDVKLSEMINYCKMYLSLCCTRYKGIVDYEFDIDDSLMNLTVPKFMIQPIIENSINHGLDKDRKDNLIKIKAKITEDNDLQITVEDNGIGISEEKISDIKTDLKKNLQKPNSIGLMNINSRIQMKFGTNYGIDITSNKEIGTEVKVKIPILKGGDENVQTIST